MTKLLDVSLDDKYTAAAGRVFLTGIQALVRLPMAQRERDLAAGHNTAGYVTGYRGSPLGQLDQQMARAKPLLADHHIVHQPAVNEDLAATACLGTQQVGLDGEGKYDGVFAIWYGKGPGVDRSGDAIRHGNLAGSSALGGVLLLLGDDHTCESSTTAHQSEYAMVDGMVPVLNPAGVQEILDYGLIGIAMSRYSGAWVSLKCVHDTVESTATAVVGPDRPAIRRPDDHDPPADGVNVRWPDNGLGQSQSLAQERRLHEHKLEAARAFARANGLDRLVLGAADAPLCVVTAGKSWLDLLQALEDLGIDDARARELGLRVYKLGMTWPLEPVAAEDACQGALTVMVIEEKRGLIESQLKELFYGQPSAPVIIGKRDEHGATLFPSYGALSSNMMALAIARRLQAPGYDEALGRRLAELEARERTALSLTSVMARLPYFCAGCPHNSSTVVPEGSKGRAGIGCHFMVQWMDRDTQRFTQMGGEGASWIGEAPFSKRGHIFQNIGDGTYYHSGLLAIRAAVASGANITFKVLFNDAVAMTGGQKMETANLDVPRIARELDAENVREVAVVTDDPDKYPLGAHFPEGVRVFHRDQLDEVQRRLRNVEGTTAIVYDQTCAAEKRRRRKRGEFPDPDRRVVINELVCEGCGDCGVQSNCVAIQPKETEFGRKRRIDQSSCNKDFSCLKGFCPSFVTVHGGQLRKPERTGDVPFPVLPEPELPALEGPFGIVVGGVGGTGVVTIAAVLGMAAHLEGKGFAAIDMIGLAQKGGSVLSHLKIAPGPGDIGAPRVAAGGARLLLGADIVVAARPAALGTALKGVTAAVVSLDETMTGAFTRQPDLAFPASRLREAIEQAVGAERTSFVEAGRLAVRLLGDAIAANMFLVGFAWQRGLLPLSREAIERAIELNGVSVHFNKRAFLWGRRAAAEPMALDAITADRQAEPRAATLAELIERRTGFLAAYQNEAYALRYRRAIEPVHAAETRELPGRTELTEAVARSLFKLMAYKDEYEVARLFTDGSFEKQLGAEFASWGKLEFHLAPPVLGERDAAGRLRKRRYGRWMMPAFRALAKLKWLRGTPLDPFGWMAERRTERRLIAAYETLLDDIARSLTAGNHAVAVELASLPLGVRGFGHVKEANLRRVQAREAELLPAMRGDLAMQQAAE